LIGKEKAKRMKNVKYLKCIQCMREYPADFRYTCSFCGREGILDVVYDYEYIKTKLTKESLKLNKDLSMWRYKDLLPLSSNVTIDYSPIGWTPLYYAEKLAQKLEFKFLWIKDEGRNPTGSLKDRSSSLGVLKAKEFNFPTITCASGGNAATSLAAFARFADIQCVVFVPSNIKKGRLAQLIAFGAKIVSVLGTYDEAYDLCNQVVKEWGWYNRNCAINPYLIEGKKTVALEICEQMGWEVPDWVVVPVSDGCTIAGIWKGFSEFKRIGLIKKLPKLIGIQAEGCKPLVDAFRTGEPIKDVIPNTIADVLATGHPNNGIKALNAVRESGGILDSVKDEEIVSAIMLLAYNTGIFGEPAGVAGLAGLLKNIKNGKIDKNESVVLIMTGNGLKDVDQILKINASIISSPPNFDKLKKELIAAEIV
jgi:threonine synthase